MAPLKTSEYPKDQHAGFTLVEIAIVAAIIGILSALAIPAFKRSQENTKIATIENDLRIYEQDFETYAMENRLYPPSQPVAGQFPEGMAERMRETWKLPSPIGGTYRWFYTNEEDPSKRSAYIEILNSSENPISISQERLKDIDAAIDDGDLSSGQFILSGLDVRYYIKL